MSQRTTPRLLTVRAIAAMKPGEWLADPAARGAGRLQVRKLASGEALFYYRYAAPGGERVRMPLGSGLELAEARRIADELSRRYQGGERDLREVLQAEQREAQRQRDAATRAADDDAAKQAATFGALMLAYVGHLKRAGRISARETEGTLRLHVERQWPKLWATPAADVTTDDLLPVLARVASGDSKREGSKRQAAKVRSYFSAAYAAGIRARQDPLALPELTALRIKSNPARDIATIEGSSRTRERALSVAELVAYWKRIAKIEGADGALLRFHLLTGGQRTDQLARVTMQDFDRDLPAVILRDPKGRRTTARLHVVPLLPEAMAAMEEMRGGGLGPFLFTVDAGATAASYAQLLTRMRAVADAMTDAGELEGGRFTPGDLRRTVETRLAGLKVNAEDRAQLQSHGLGGVQNRHYNRHDYFDEKWDALVKLRDLVSSKRGTVVPLGTRRRSVRA